ncbi:MAG TPA: 3-deoxy-manno-octulosonate cytidylyltransferase, partial [Desulfobacteraceae bacterium]|nr:3-deoxy-manno-octulosonate cytidylyltransferase [Desulfobacteraceae bacterium]
SECERLTDIWIATDDRSIKSCVEEFGGKVLITKKEHPTGTDRVAEAARYLKLSPSDIVVNIQGDQPLFKGKVLNLLIDSMLNNPSIQMSTLIYRIRDQREIDDRNCVKVVMDLNGFAIFFSRSPIPFYRDREIDRIYYKHLGFYAYRMDFLKRYPTLPRGRLEVAESLEQLRAIENGIKIKVVESPSDSYEVDTPQDIEKIERLLS